MPSLFTAGCTDGDRGASDIIVVSEKIESRRNGLPQAPLHLSPGPSLSGRGSVGLCRVWGVGNCPFRKHQEEPWVEPCQPPTLDSVQDSGTAATPLCVGLTQPLWHCHRPLNLGWGFSHSSSFLLPNAQPEEGWRWAPETCWGRFHYAPGENTIGPLPWQLGGIYTHTQVQERYPLQAVDPPCWSEHAHLQEADICTL